MFKKLKIKNSTYVDIIIVNWKNKLFTVFVFYSFTVVITHLSICSQRRRDPVSNLFFINLNQIYYMSPFRVWERKEKR